MCVSVCVREGFFNTQSSCLSPSFCVSLCLFQSCSVRVLLVEVLNYAIKMFLSLSLFYSLWLSHSYCFPLRSLSLFSSLMMIAFSLLLLSLLLLFPLYLSFISSYLFLCLSMHLSASLFLHLSLPVSLSLWFSLSVSVSFYLCIFLTFLLSVFPSISSHTLVRKQLLRRINRCKISIPSPRHPLSGQV